MEINIKEKLVKYFESYDALDIVSKFGAMNLEFCNQNKNLLTSYISIVGLLKMNSGKPKASNKTIQNIISDLNQSNILPIIQDPSESPFIENVYLDKEYKVFNGINNSSAYYVNSIIELLLYRKTGLDETFKQHYLKLIKAALVISDCVFHRAGLTQTFEKEHYESNDLLYTNNLSVYQQSLFFSKKEISQIISEEDFSKYFLCNCEDMDIDKCLKDEFPFYYFAPLLNCKEKVLLIDPTCISIFIKNLGLRLGNEYGCLEYYLKCFYEATFDYSIEKCKMLSGIFPYSENKILVEKAEKYRYEAYLVGNKIVLMVAIACDNLYKNPFGNNGDMLFKTVFKKLKETGYEKENVYTIILLGSYDGKSAFFSNYRFVNSPVILPCSDVDIIQINEKLNPFFIENFSHFLNYYFPGDSISMVFSTTNLIAVLNEKDYDFYFSDDVNVRENFLNLGFDFIYPYYIKAIKEQQESVAVYDGVNVPIKLIKYDDNVYFPNPIICPISNVKPLCTRIGKGSFWVVSKFTDEHGLLISRVICYWINQISEQLSKKVNRTYYIQVEEDKNDTAIYKIGEARCLLNYKRSYIESFANSDNRNEITMTANVLDALSLLDDHIKEKMVEYSRVQNKKIIYTINVEENPLVKPISINLPPMRKSNIYISMLDDKMGEYIGRENNLGYGMILEPKIVLTKIVNKLYADFELFMSKYDWESAILKCYLYSEKLVSELLLYNDNTKHQLILYPEHKIDIEKNLNEINTSSMSIRFVVEYLAAIRTLGTTTIDDVDIQYAISLVASTVKWAKLCDSFEYGLVDKINYLKSKRIGYDHSKIDEFNSLLSDVSFYDTTHVVSNINYQPKTFPLKDEINQAYLFEHGFTIQQMMSGITAALAFGEAQNNEIKSSTIEELIDFIHHNDKINITDDIFIKIINFLSLDYRGKYYDGVIKNRELHPWKYNREWSLMRKPFIRRNGKLFWGNRMLYHSYLFILQTIHNGKEPSHKTGKDSIMVLNGKMLGFIGDDFNDYCFDYLKEKIPELKYDKCVKSINNKKIENKKGETLGDVDILAIDLAKKKIYLIETKRFYYSRDPSELDAEIKKMFVGYKNKKSFLSLELNRKKWFEEHINDVLAHYGLTGSDWKVRYTFLTYKPLISARFTKNNINNTYLKEISLRYLRNLK